MSPKLQIRDLNPGFEASLILYYSAAPWQRKKKERKKEKGRKDERGRKERREGVRRKGRKEEKEGRGRTFFHFEHPMHFAIIKIGILSKNFWYTNIL